MNILSKNIEVFPVAKPRVAVSGQTNGGRLFTEYYVANIIRQLIGTNGFIINCATSAGDAYGNSFQEDANFNIDFNIDGYYFRVKDLQLSKNIISNFQCNSVPKNKDGSYSTDGKYYVVATISDYDTSLEISGQDTKEADKNFYYTGLDISVQWVKNGTKPSGNHLILFDLAAKIDNNTLEVTKITVHKESYQKFSPESVHITGIDGKYA